MSLSGYSIKDDVAMQMTQEYLNILYCYIVNGEVGANTVLHHLRSKYSKFYWNVLLRVALNHLIKKLRNQTGWTSDFLTSDQDVEERRKTSIKYKNDIAVIGLIAKYADLSARDQNKKRAVDYVLQELNLSEVAYSSAQHYVACSNPNLNLKLEDGLTRTLLYSVMDGKVLNSPFRWGYSYFGAFVLLGWWKLVEWGLEHGADVSDDRVCDFIPLDAAYVDRRITATQMSSNLFSRLLHPTNVDRPIGPLDIGTGAMDTPMHLMTRLNDYQDHYQHLLIAGASTDLRNFCGYLPIDYYTTHLTNIPMINKHHSVASRELDVFRSLIPKSEGISPKLFLSALLAWKFSPTEDFKQLFVDIFSQSVMLSSGWQELSLYETDAFTRGQTHECLGVLIDGSSVGDLLTADLRKIQFISRLFQTCGIRANRIEKFVAFKTAITDRNSSRLDEIKETWNEYTTSVPSLQLQCTRVIRSAMRVVSEERLQALPLPKAILADISLKTVIEEVYDEFHP